LEEVEMVSACYAGPVATTQREYNQVSPERVYAVPAVTDELASAVAELEQVAVNLATRLAPVTRIEPSECCDKPCGAGDPCIPELVVRIGSQVERVHAVRRMLEDAARRLEV
jgi:hypothetical protein